jgi:O-antigen/teichoic acid export membrane protein
MIATPLSHLFSISINLFYLAVAFAVLFVFFTLTMSAVRGLNRMRAYSVFQIVYGPIVLISFLVFIFNHQLSFETMVFPILAAYISLTICTYFIFIRKLARWKFDISTAKMLWKFSIFSAIGGLSYAFYTNVDRIMIGRYLPVGDVGIYAAYYTASINIAGLFWGMFNMVYFPTISGYENKGTIFVRINKLIPFLISLGIPFLIICEYIVLKLYGASYSLNIFWMLFFSVTSICVIVDGLYGWLLQAIGLQGIKITSIAAVVIAVVNTGLNLILIPKFGIAGAIICLMISYIISIIIKLTFGRNYLLKGEE